MKKEAGKVLTIFSALVITQAITGINGFKVIGEILQQIFSAVGAI
jgi:hypothetical protein